MKFMKYTDIQLKQTLAKMLPEKVKLSRVHANRSLLIWTDFTHDRAGHEVLDTELLHLCWLVEESLTLGQYEAYGDELANVQKANPFFKTETMRAMMSSTWQQRTNALAKTLRIEIV